MKNAFMIFLSFADLSNAFLVQRERGVSIKSALHDYDPKGRHITFNPLEGYQSVDLARAKECAENFGKCSVQEMEQIKSSK
jgi:hypothetical protein